MDETLYKMASEDEDFSDLLKQCEGIPLHALRTSVRRFLSKYLDVEGAMYGDRFNDYNGLAELAGFDYKDIQNFQRHRSPTEQLLHTWGNRPDLHPTCENLVKYLLQLDRRDILTDCRDFIVKEIEEFKKNTSNLLKQTDRFSQIPQQRNENGSRLNEDEVISVEDAVNGARGDMHYWDAFVIYNPEGKDLSFVKQMADILEGPEYNLRLFIPWRDDLPGTAQHEVTAKLIAERCRRTIVILSTDFHKSSVADFQLKFAQCLSPGARSKKVIPIRINMCGIPSILKIVTVCDFTKEETIEWAWPRVAAVLKSPLNPDPRQYSVSPETLKDIKLDTEFANIPKAFWALTVATMPFPDPYEAPT